MHKEFDTLYLAWRIGKGQRRFLVGKIEFLGEEAQFSYIEEGVRAAQEKGFQYYPDFPDITRVYSHNVLSSFGNRLNNSRRADIQEYYDFWDIPADKTTDIAYMLAHTGALLPTDNFEILADYHPLKGLKFVSEICGLSQTIPNATTVNVGDVLRYEFEQENTHDPNAILLYKNDIRLGYVKRIHNRVFKGKGIDDFHIRVKSKESNGVLRRCFIEIEYKG